MAEKSDRHMCECICNLYNVYSTKHSEAVPKMVRMANMNLYIHPAVGDSLIHLLCSKSMYKYAK